MATYENTDPNPSLAKDMIIRDIFTELPKKISYNIILRLPCKTLLILRSVSKSCMTLISSPDLIDTHLFKSNNGVFSRLPKVIIYNIFLRLRVETLSRLKSVSKSWLSLISDSDFVKTHLLKSTNDPHFTRYRLHVSSCPFMPNGEHDTGARLDLESLSLYSLLNEPITEIMEHHHADLDDHDYQSDRVTHVVGCCNGLVCLASRFCPAFLWNPSTGESRRLTNLIPAELNNFHAYAYGFCYDESNDDFKVYSIFSPNTVSVYSLKTDGSRMIADFPCEVSWNIYYKGMFANEAMHWACRPDRKSKIIVSLDIKTETFGEVLPPIYGEGVCCWMLGTFGKSLSFCRFDSTHADFWVMNKIGMEESWTKLFTIPYVDRPTQLAFLKPINITLNGEIIMMLNSRIQLYNSKDNTYKELFDRGEYREHYRSTDDDDKRVYSYGFDCEVNTYVESLISPHL